MGASKFRFPVRLILWDNPSIVSLLPHRFRRRCRMKRLSLLGIGLLALFVIGPARAQDKGVPVDDLMKSLDAKGKTARLKALAALGSYGNHAKKAVPAVAPLLRDKDNDL